jgi:hypothetical protein
MLTKAEIVAGLTDRPIPFQAGGLSVWLRPWQLPEKAALAEWQAAHKDDPDFAVALTVRMVLLSVCDESGALVFGEDDAGVVGRLNAVALESVAAKSLELNGIAEGKAPSPTGPNSGSPVG